MKSIFHPLSTVRWLAYLLLSCTDRFITPVPNAVYIPLMLGALFLVGSGLWLARRPRRRD